MPLDLVEMKKKSRRAVTGCGVGRISDALDDEDRATLAEALGDPSITGVAIAEVLTADGHDIAAKTVQNHRRGECSCG